MSIEKVISYCWFGHNPLPEKVKICISSWKRMCPDYKIIEWNESNYDINKHPYMRDAYKNKKWAFVSDYARLDIIYEHGGIYLDLRQTRQSFKHRNGLSGMPLLLLVKKQSRMKSFKTSCKMNIIFLSKHNVGVIAICRRNGTSSYRSVLWETAAKENVWKDSLFRTPRRICGTRKNPY